MTVLRHIVFPALRLLVWAVIAVALSVLAFGGDRSAPVSGGPLDPVADPSTSTVAVSTGDIESSITVSGTVSADAASTVKSTASGTVSRISVEVGDAVDVGDRLVQVRVPLEPEEGTTVTAPDGTVTTTPPRERHKTVTVTAASKGTVTGLAVLLDQEVTVGQDVATISPGTLSVQAPLTQSQQFRLLEPPASASAQAPGGPAPFDCADLRTGAAASDAPLQPDPMTGMMPEQTTAQVTCRVPAGTTVFAGMSVDLTIDTGSATGVLVLPVSSVLGSVGSGTVWVVQDGGEPVEQPVTLGITDGEQVQVTEGLAEGDQVLEFTPVPMDDEPQIGPEGQFG